MKFNRMKCMKRVILFILAMGILAGCNTPFKMAPVEDRSSSLNKEVPRKVLDSRTQYMVKKGDTLHRIALDKGLSYADLVAWNNLANPNDIKVDQVLQIAAPDGVVTGQTSGIGSPAGVEVRSLASGAGSTGAAGVAANNKNSPRADKRPYSESALAELQKTDTGVVTTPKPAEKSPGPAIVDEIVWMWPTEGKIIGNFDDSKNKGVDISGKLGQDILAAGAGTVMYAGSGIRGYGNLVIIKHSNNLLSAYAHNKTIIVKEKQAISKGQKIAEMGNSDSDVVKLHFEIRQQGKPVDPLKFLPGRSGLGNL